MHMVDCICWIVINVMNVSKYGEYFNLIYSTEIITIIIVLLFCYSDTKLRTKDDWLLNVLSKKTNLFLNIRMYHDTEIN